MVTLVSGAILICALTNACIAVLYKAGRVLLFVFLVDALLLINIGGSLIYTLVKDPGQLKIQLGEYLTISALPATLIALGLFAAPLAACVVWAGRGVYGRHAHLQ